MSITILRSSTSNIIEIPIPVKSLTYASSISINVKTDNESAGVTYTGGNIEDISALGTFAAPTSGKVRFKEVFAMTTGSLYQLMIADSRFAVASSRRMVISIWGAAIGSDVLYEIDLLGETDVVKWRGSQPSALASGLVQSDVQAIDNNGNAADYLASGIFAFGEDGERWLYPSDLVALVAAIRADLERNDGDLDTLINRLTSTRASYLDALNVPTTVASQESIEQLQDHGDEFWAGDSGTSGSGSEPSCCEQTLAIVQQLQLGQGITLEVTSPPNIELTVEN